jgi:hypothetical protein
MRQVLNYNGKKGPMLPEKEYEEMRRFIIDTFGTQTEVSLKCLMQRALENELVYPNENALWHLLKVKQDLEARGIIKIRFVGNTPKVQMLRINRKVLKQADGVGLP